MKYIDWLGQWLENYIRPSVKVRTYERYRLIIEQHIKDKIGGMELNDLSPLVLQSFITELLQSGNRKTGKGLSPNSVNAVISVIQSSLKTAHLLGLMKEYTADKLKRPKLTEKPVECFTLAEQKQMEQAVLNGKKDKLYGIILCLYSGLRIGELIALQWSDIDFAKGILTVSKSCHDGRGGLIIDEPKTATSRRVIPLPKQLLPILKGIKKKSDSPFVVSSNGKPVSVRSYQRSFELLLKKLKISHKGFHSLRHTFATRALECGMDVKTLSEILGHKNPTVTLNRYAHSLMEHFPQTIQLDDDYVKSDYLLDKALKKQQELRSLFLQRKKEINPLILVQLPNNSDALLETVEKFFEQKGITYEAGTLSLWLSERHENLEDISANNGKQIALIIKQAVATGWDCPRAHILVKLRYTRNESFTIQTIGRIRRMPEARHYDNDALDSCYLYTFDDTFTQGAKAALGKSAFDAKLLSLKEEHRGFTLTKEQRTMITDLRDPRRALASIAQFMEKEYGLTGDKKQNRVRLENKGYIFSDKIVRRTVSGKLVELEDLSKHENMNDVAVVETLNTHVHGREYHHEVGKIGLEIGLQYAYMNTIISKLFSEKSSYYKQVLSLPTRELYAFVISNSDLLRRMCRTAMAAQLAQTVMTGDFVSEKEFKFPQSTIFTYNPQSKVQTVSTKNVYEGYLLSAEPRSSSEKKFEKFCETCNAVDWIFKNGDKGDEYFSIVYSDNSGAQKLFYPDYVLSVNGETWIIETKGGFNRTGESEDIDIFSPKKFEVLGAYLDKHGLKGGFVRYDKQSEELCFCTENYSDDIHSESWKILNNVW